MNEFYDHIEDYISGKLVLQEKTEFEAAMQSDQNLAEAVQNFYLAKKLSASLIEDEARQILHAFKTKPKSNTHLFYFIAASILVLIIAFYFVVLKDKKPVFYDDKQIFAQLYESPASMASRNETDLLTALDTAIQYFDQGNLESSKQILETLATIDSSNLKVIRYLAHIHLQQNNVASSEIEFKKILSSGTADQQSEAEYNLIVIYILQRNKVEALNLFNALKMKNVISKDKLKLLEQYINTL